MKFSIVTACRNAAQYIEETVDSVLDQSVFRSGRCKLEYLVFDGASTDATVEILRRYERHGVMVVSEPDEGFYAALAKGLQRTTGDCVAYLNAGDFLHRGGLAVAADCFALDRVDWLTGYATVCNDRSQIFHCRLPYCFRKSLFDCGAYGTALPFVQQESTLWRRRLHDTIDFRVLEKLRFAGDGYLWRCFSSVAELYVVRAMIGCFRVHKGQISAERERYRQELASLSRPMTLRDRLQSMVDRTFWSAPDRLKMRMNRTMMISHHPGGETWKLDAVR